MRRPNRGQRLCTRTASAGGPGIVPAEARSRAAAGRTAGHDGTSRGSAARGMGCRYGRGGAARPASLLEGLPRTMSRK
eukprot:scaffold13929_cov97-Isochrysis_galbana.AAC.6